MSYNIPPLNDDNVKMDKGLKILSEITHFNKYAKYVPKLKRREIFEETVDRYINMMIKKYPDLKDSIINNSKFVFNKEILPSMRAMQFSGDAIEKNESRIYNCCFLPIDSYVAFSEIMFLLLGGTGVGYSVQNSHIEKLPEIQKPTKSQKYLVGDSIEGWADAVKHLMKSYFGLRKSKPLFDFSDIRPKGARLVTAGGKAPGPGPLRVCLAKIESILETKSNGEKLTSLEVHDIVCHIADSVLAGGIRRAALISLFSADDEMMLACKSGNWWELNPQRGRANNSAVILRHIIKKPFFKELWSKIKNSNSGEPGLYFSNNANWGANPCCEIALRPFQFCNLCEINASTIKSQQDFNNRAMAASFFGTLQAGFTNFHYLRPIWKETTEKEALTGVGITGIASGNLNNLSLEEAANIVKKTNEDISSLIGINLAARTTTVKPSGSTSCLLGTSSGIHAWHSKYFIRRMQCTKDEPLYKYLSKYHSYLIDDYKAIPNSAVIEIPVSCSSDSVTREIETSTTLLDRVSRFNKEWVREGHRYGHNTNNVSATISIKDDEWDKVSDWIWSNRETFNGLSVLPYDGGTYVQAPFEEISKSKYYSLVNKLKNIDLTKVTEEEDNTDLSSELACGSGGCEII